MGGVFAIGKMEMESGLSGAILRHANFFACEEPNVEFFGGNSGFHGRIIYQCPPPCGAANAVSEGGERQGVSFGTFSQLSEVDCEKAICPRFSAFNSNEFEFLMALANQKWGVFFGFFNVLLVIRE